MIHRVNKILKTSIIILEKSGIIIGIVKGFCPFLCIPMYNFLWNIMFPLWFHLACIRKCHIFLCRVATWVQEASAIGPDKPQQPKQCLTHYYWGQFQAHTSHLVSYINPIVLAVILHGWQICCRKAEQIVKPGNGTVHR